MCDEVYVLVHVHPRKIFTCTEAQHSSFLMVVLLVCGPKSIAATRTCLVSSTVLTEV